MLMHLISLVVLHQAFTGCLGNSLVSRMYYAYPGQKVDTTDIEGKQEPHVVSGFRPLPFPVNFRLYDVNKDGHIDIRELVSVTGEAENVEQAFQSSDLNGDGLVSRTEYSKVPWGYNRDRDVVLPDTRA